MTLKLAVVGKKGGIGKTTTAIHISAHLAFSGQRTILIDGDDEAYATTWVSGGHMPFAVEGLGGLMTVGNYDAAVIDSQAGPSDTEIVTLGKHSDVLILPVIPETQSVKGVLKTVGVLDAAGIPRSRVAALLTLDTRVGTATADARAALEGAGVHVLKATIRETRAVRHASAQSALVHQVRSNSGKMAWLDYEAATKELRSLA